MDVRRGGNGAQAGLDPLYRPRAADEVRASGRRRRETGNGRGGVPGRIHAGYAPRSAGIRPGDPRHAGCAQRAVRAGESRRLFGGLQRAAAADRTRRVQSPGDRRRGGEDAAYLLLQRVGTELFGDVRLLAQDAMGRGRARSGAACHLRRRRYLPSRLRRAGLPVGASLFSMERG